MIGQDKFPMKQKLPWILIFCLTGDLYLGDVGQNTWEEVDFQPSTSPGGENYGWNIMEGLECYNSSTWENTELLNSPFQISSFGEDESGEIYFADRASGIIYKIIEPTAGQ